MVLPAATEEEAKAALEALAAETPDATHHCWAWRLGPEQEERASDDGEPAGTAGLPMLQVLRGAELSDVLAVVVRWYGGVKLGKGGLVRAYAGAVRLALEQVRTRRKVPQDQLEVTLPYSQVGAVKRLVRPPEVVLAHEAYGAEVSLVLSVHRHLRPELEASLADLSLEARELPSENP